MLRPLSGRLSARTRHHFSQLLHLFYLRTTRSAQRGPIALFRISNITCWDEEIYERTHSARIPECLNFERIFFFAWRIYRFLLTFVFSSVPIPDPKRPMIFRLLFLHLERLVRNTREKRENPETNDELSQERISEGNEQCFVLNLLLHLLKL